LITVIGMVGDTISELNQDAIQRLISAKTVLANRSRAKAIAKFVDTANTKIEEYPKPLSSLAEIVASVEHPVVVVASGDPGFFGITSYLSANNLDFEVLPAPSSVSIAAARLKIPWEDKVVLSAHGRKEEEFVSALDTALSEDNGGVFVLCGPKLPPLEILSLIGARGVKGHEIWIFEDLMTDRERVTGPEPPHKDYSSNSVVLLLKRRHPDTASLIFRSELPSKMPSAFSEKEFSHPDRNFSKIEVKALVMALLQVDSLSLGSVFLEVGAGYGGVGILAARLRPDLVLYQYEKDARKIPTIRTNLKSFGVTSVLKNETFNPNEVNDIDPAAIFFGGGGVELAYETAKALRRPARICAVLVSPLDLSLAYEAFGNVKEIVSFTLSPFSKSSSHTRLVPSNPVFLAWNEI
jgi:precorrin-6Y C5,15-methyltransferase (decarboxylating)